MKIKVMLNFLRSITVVLLFILIGTLLVHSLDSINQDIGRHLKSGEIIWQTKNVYKTNLFSFTEPNHPFINHHWLSEVAFFLLNGVVGLKGLIIFKTIALLTAFCLLFKSVSQKTGIWPLLVAIPISVFVFIDRTDVRPELFSYLFLAFFLFAIFQAKYQGNYKWFYALPFVELLWVNFHIYFALGPGLLFLYSIDRFFNTRSEFKKVFLTFCASSLATLLNPNFLSGVLAPFNILREYGYTIVENQSVSFLKNYGILIKQINIFEFSLLVLFLSFIPSLINKRKVIFEFLTAAVFSFLALKMIRNFGTYALTFLPIVALNLHSLKLSDWVKNLKTKVIFYSTIILLLLFLITNTANNNTYAWFNVNKTFGLNIPAGAGPGVEFVKQNNIQGPVFNNFDVGSFLIWKLYPQQKVFVDGRPEAYSVNFLENVYKAMQEDPAVWKKYSEEYKINYIFFDYHDITPWAQTFLESITKNPEWAAVYLDNSVIILLKRNQINKKIIDTYFTH